MKTTSGPGHRHPSRSREHARSVAVLESPLDDPTPDQPFVEGAQDSIDPDLRHRLISEAAYRRYVDRGYADGYDVDDWLSAETEVDHLLANPPDELAS